MMGITFRGAEISIMNGPIIAMIRPNDSVKIAGLVANRGRIMKKPGVKHRV